MLIHPWDAARDDSEWQQWLAVHDFGQLAVNGLPGEAPYVQPLHFLYDDGRGEVLTHLARPNPVWPALEANPDVVLSVVDDYVYAPGHWQAAGGREDAAEIGRLVVDRRAGAAGYPVEARPAEVGPGGDQGVVVVDELGHGRVDFLRRCGTAG